MKLNFLKMSDLDLKDKKVFIRVDFNVPITKDGKIQNDNRLKATLETIKLAVSKGAAVILGSHLGRPKEGEFDPSLTLAPISSWLTVELNQPVDLIRSYLQGINVRSGQVVLLENLRFNVGEKKCYDALSKQLAEMADIFVMDAFGAAHRAQASTYGMAKFAPIVCAGPLLVKEVENISKSVENAEHPLVAIVGGSKVSGKLTLLEKLLDKVDTLIVGGGIANTFLAAKGVRVGKSLYEPDLVETCVELLVKAEEMGVNIPLPLDVGVAEIFNETASSRYVDISETTRDDIILDVGEKTAKLYSDIIREAKTILWNGPVGVFEFENFSFGTESLAKAIARSEAFSIAGGGDTIAAVEKFGVTNSIDYITTGGGAFLEFVEGKKLPAIEILETRFSENK